MTLDSTQNLAIMQRRFLNGSEVDFTQTADEGLSSNNGYILQVAHDAEGKAIMDYDKKELVKNELRGNVLIKIGSRMR